MRVDRLIARERDFGGVEIGLPARQPRLRLRDVSRRDIAGVERLARGLQGLPQERNVGALCLDQGLIGEHVHIGGDRGHEHDLLDIAQTFASGTNRRFGLAHRVAGAESIEQRLRQRHPRHPRAKIGVLLRAVRKRVPGRIVARKRADGEGGAIAGQRLRHGLVGRTQLCARRIELRIVLIDPRQHLGECLGRGAAGHSQC